MYNYFFLKKIISIIFKFQNINNSDKNYFKHKMGCCGTEKATLTNSINQINSVNETNIQEDETMNETKAEEIMHKINEIKEYKVSEKDLNSSFYNKFQW